MKTKTYETSGAPSVTVDTLCDRIDEMDRVIHAFVSDSETGAARRERVRGELQRVHERWPVAESRPPLFGVPVAVKDIVNVDGLPTRGGSALPPEVFEGGQAGVVDRLRHAGALIAGKTVTAEFAMTAPGPTVNPHAHDHTPGGSSSGSAAAVAAGMVPLAIGTQTVGSMIRPAAYCGVVGFKPTARRIPVDGVIANVPTLDTIGVFAATLSAVATAAAVLCDGWQPVRDVERKRPVLGVPDGPYLEQAGTEARAAFEAQVAALSSAGFPVRRIPMFSDLARAADDLFTVNRYEAAQSHAEWFPRYGALYRQQSVATIRQGQAISREQYEHGLRRREAFRISLSQVTDEADVDVWICPAATGPAPHGLAGTGSSAMCLPWSYAGWPSLSVPAGRTENGLPLGLQCVSPAGSDERLLDRAQAIETLMPPTGFPPHR
ncbi:amidase [Kitasatospora sp. NBC_01287]|uniref:amidase n=1 Tax=Kitasatospora sp. NBC_01287 TaxID=2903573 RepID=UPI00224CF163|nr:amidase [Kitasatospora sp. NBC_01287]MCX4749749.1 amidase [Kitasatospora sp. NBC_01287]